MPTLSKIFDKRKIMLCHNKSLYLDHSLQEPYKESTQVILFAEYTGQNSLELRPCRSQYLYSGAQLPVFMQSCMSDIYSMYLNGNRC